MFFMFFIRKSMFLSSMTLANSQAFYAYVEYKLCVNRYRPYSLILKSANLVILSNLHHTWAL